MEVFCGECHAREAAKRGVAGDGMNETKNMRAWKEAQTEVCTTEKQPDGSRVAAFFDLDGTLFAKPSLERRALRALAAAGRIRPGNYAAWLREMIRLLPRGMTYALQANKRYLRGVAVNEVRETANEDCFFALPEFFSEALEQVCRHAREGHTIVLLSGTLEPLAMRAAAALRRELKARGFEAAMHVCATRLEEIRGRWSGNIAGEPMFGEAKARAAARLAKEMWLELPLSSAYADSEQDRWLLASVGRPHTVNASRGLRRLARLYGWPMLRWDERIPRTGASALTSHPRIFPSPAESGENS
jgi:phosphoserine phosphatase